MTLSQRNGIERIDCIGWKTFLRRLATKEEFCAIYSYYLKNKALFTSGIKSGAEYWTSSPHSYRAGHYYNSKIWTNDYPCMPSTMPGHLPYEVLPVRNK